MRRAFRLFIRWLALPLLAGAMAWCGADWFTMPSHLIIDQDVAIDALHLSADGMVVAATSQRLRCVDLFDATTGRLLTFEEYDPADFASRLTPDGALNIWTVDGAKHRNFVLYRLDPRTGVRTVVFERSFGKYFAPKLAGDGKTLVLLVDDEVSSEEGWRVEVWDTLKQKRCISTRSYWATYPAYDVSPDGRRLVVSLVPLYPPGSPDLSKVHEFELYDVASGVRLDAIETAPFATYHADGHSNDLALTLLNGCQFNKLGGDGIDWPSSEVDKLGPLLERGCAVVRGNERGVILKEPRPGPSVEEDTSPSLNIPFSRRALEEGAFVPGSDLVAFKWQERPRTKSGWLKSVEAHLGRKLVADGPVTHASLIHWRTGDVVADRGGVGYSRDGAYVAVARNGTRVALGHRRDKGSRIEIWNLPITDHPPWVPWLCGLAAGMATLALLWYRHRCRTSAHDA